MNKYFKLIALAFALNISLNVFGIEDVRLLRFPDINDNLVAFVYAGDIWTVSADGGDAKHLTTHEGFELFPKISPDGRWIAFSGEYSGTRQVFVVSSQGGVPRQLTWYNSIGVMPPRGGYDNVVLDWTPDSRQILFRSNRTTFGERQGKYFLIGLEGGMETPLPLVNGGFGVLSPDAGSIVFTPVDREFRNWKRYKGGRATDLWIYDLNANTSEQITDFTGSDQLPVWSGDNIFFASDRDLKLNIWQYNLKTKETTQVTKHSDYDVMWPSGNGDYLVYENGGYIYKMNLSSGSSEKLKIDISFDNPNLIPYYKDVKGNIQSFNISPSGKRAIFDARGDIFSVPAENGITENLTQSQGIREVYPTWSPDGRFITYYSDKTGEYELYILENRKGSVPRQVTYNSSAWKYEPLWSPDSRYLLIADRTLKLYLLEVSSGKITEVDNGTSQELSGFSFSPDSRWIVYSKTGDNQSSSLWFYDVKAGRTRQGTEGIYSDNNAFFSLDGRYLFFTSNRDFNLTYSDYEFDYLFNNSTRMYAVALTDTTPPLFRDKNDVEPFRVEEPSTKAAVNKKAGIKPPDVNVLKKDPEIVIDFEGLNDRIISIPGSPGDYSIAGAVEGGFLYISGNKLMKYNIEEEKSEEILDRVTNVSISADNKSVLYSAGGDFGIIKVAPGQKAGAGKLNLSGLEMKIDPKLEWYQIFADSWRIFRDYFYVSNLHGVNWDQVRRRYAALLPYVSHRADLDYILNELVAEINVGHSYVDWGDFERPKRIENGLLGASIVADEDAGRYRVNDIYRGENWNIVRRSPLTEQGVNVNEGDYIISIDGKNITVKDNFYMFLENTATKTITLTVSSNPSGENPRTSLVKPIVSEQELLYMKWVDERRAIVDKLSGGRIGYIHVPNTAAAGNKELYQGMYAYFNKDALIIDDRYNGGGLIPDRMADLLDRKSLIYWHRNGLMPSKSPAVAHDGPKAMLINGYSSSGGDAFPYFFKKMGLGPLIGTRTWGGLVGISGNARLVDGGNVSVPQFGIFDREDGWIIEGMGVYPDIEVVDRPEQLAKGEDPGLMKAIEVLMKELENKPGSGVSSPAAPDRSGWHEGL